MRMTGLLYPQGVPLVPKAALPDTRAHTNGKEGKGSLNVGQSNSAHRNPVSYAPDLTFEVSSRTSAPTHPARATLTLIPPRKPNDLSRDARREVAEVLANPNTTLEEMIRQLWLEPDNPAFSPQVIRHHVAEVFSRRANFIDVLNAQITHKVPIAQLAEAVDGHHATIDRAFIERELINRGLPSPNQWFKSVDNSSVVHTRRALDAQGWAHLDGRGVKVWVAEPYEHTHAKFVGAVINDPKYGLAPGAAIETQYIAQPTPWLPGGPSLLQQLEFNFDAMVGRLTEGLRQGIPAAQLIGQLETEFEPMVAAYLESTDRRLVKQIQAFAESDAHILNLSTGRDLHRILKQIAGLADRMASLSPDLARVIAGTSDAPDSGTVLGRRIAPLLLYTAYPALSATQQAPGLRAYIEATRAAAEQGKIITVAASNGHENLQAFSARMGVSFPDVFALNAYAMSPHVIVVGASDVNGTPLDVSDDTMARFSSYGSAEHPITVATQGVNVATPYRTFIALRGGNDGTSASAPTVGGLAALYKQVFPNSTVEDFRRFLAQHAVKIDAPNEAQGAGVLNLLEAGLSLGARAGAY